MIDGRRWAEKQTAEDYVSGQSLSFQEEKDFIFAEVSVMEMMLALGASLCSASPCWQVDAHKEELPSALPVKICLNFPLLNFLSLPLPPFPCCYHCSLSCHHSWFSFLPLWIPAVCAVLSLLQPFLSGFLQGASAQLCWLLVAPCAEARPCLGQFLFAQSAVWGPQNGLKWPSCGATSASSCHLLQGGKWDQQHTKLGC